MLAGLRVCPCRNRQVLLAIQSRVVIEKHTASTAGQHSNKATRQHSLLGGVPDRNAQEVNQVLQQGIATGAYVILIGLNLRSFEFTESRKLVSALLQDMGEPGGSGGGASVAGTPSATTGPRLCRRRGRC